VQAPPSSGFLRGTPLTERAVALSALTMLCTMTCLVWVHASLPDLLPVRFRWDGRPVGWQFRTLPRVLMPVFVQLGLFGTFGAVSGLLLYRADGDTSARKPDGVAARVAAEAVMLMAAVWIGFQAYAAFALVGLWSGGRSTLGPGYSVLEGVCLVATLSIGVRARARLGRPGPLPYDAAHWRLGQLYCNAGDPALFVPTREGGRWTLNFGRPSAALLLGGVLVAGIVTPTLILALALRWV
jgi:uncharacterized membrane protein